MTMRQLVGLVMRLVRSTFVTISLLISGCQRVPPADDSDVTLLVQERINKQVRWNQNVAVDPQVACLVDHLLKQPLQKNGAVQIALLHNPEIQATFEKLGIAHADLLEAGLFQNPFFQGFVSVPNKHSSFSVSQGFLDIFLIPLRKKVAQTEFDQAKLFVADAILDLAFTVEETYYSLQAEESRLRLLEHLIEAHEASLLLAREQQRVGNSSDIQAQKYASLYLEIVLERAKCQNQIATFRNKMNAKLGLSPSQANWQIPYDLPKVAQEALEIEAIEKRALSQRLDVEQKRLEIQRIIQIGKTKKWWSFTDPAVAIAAEDDHIGPAVSGTLPFFNHGQADRERLHAMRRQAEHELKALEIDVKAEVQMLWQQLINNKNRVRLYQDEFLPLQETIVTQSQHYYNVMGLSVYLLLEKKQNELQAHINYTMALKDYWVTKVALDRAVGGEI